MECALWLNRKKVYSAAEISANPDIASLRGYFLAGSLIEWLEDHNGKEYADKLRKLSADAPDLNDRIAEIFGGNTVGHKKLTGSTTPVQTEISKSCKNSDCRTSSFEIPCSFGFTDSSYKFGFADTSYKSVFSNSSFKFRFNFDTSYLGIYRWFVGGSFVYGSFSQTSFHEWEWEWLWNFFKGYSGGQYGSFASGSFSVSSLPTTSFSNQDVLLKLLAEINPSEVIEGSFAVWEKLGIDEYDYIMFRTLMRCPLNRFGYGIHIV